MSVLTETFVASVGSPDPAEPGGLRFERRRERRLVEYYETTGPIYAKALGG